MQTPAPRMAQERFEDIAEAFDLLEDWEDRYRYVIDLGKAMPPLAEALKVPATKVDGCASQVWIVPEIDGEGQAARLRFRGDSDALIVRGLIAVLLSLYNDLPAREVLAIDVGHELGRLGLESHLSSQRSNGLKAMIARIRAIAEAAEKGAAVV